jgi:hypothetical protein
MLEPQPVYTIGNPRRPYSSNFFLRRKSQEHGHLEDGSSGQTRLYRCNNCNLEAPIEELRVPAPGTNNYHLLYRNKGELPKQYQDILLCDSCKLNYIQWKRDYALRRPRHHPYHISLIPIAKWAEDYWKRRTQEGSKTESVLPIPWREISPGFEISRASASPQNLC